MNIKNIKIKIIAIIMIAVGALFLGGCIPLCVTPPEVPLVVRTDIAHVSSTTALLRGFVSLEVRAAWFEWGPNEGLAWRTPAISRAVGDVEILITELKPGAIYYFRIIAETRSGDLVFGKVRTFMTDPF